MHNYFEQISSVDNLLDAWSEFIKGKRNKPDVQRFSIKLMDNILTLHNDLLQKRYKHGEYKSFSIHDPKPRKIHKALVRDRLLHHAIYRILYPIFDKSFIADSFSCRLKKGTHEAMKRFRQYFYKVSANNTKTCYVLKCDIKKFFDSVDHEILMNILKRKISDSGTLWLLEEIISSFNSLTKNQLSLFKAIPDFGAGRIERERERERESKNASRKGVPIGNLTSQLFANIYLHELDKFMKHTLKVRHYIRFADDFAIFSQDRRALEKLALRIENFLDTKLRLKIHPHKIFIKTINSGVDFLGWIHFTDHRVLRTTTKKRMMRRIKASQSNETINSYLGLIGHGNTFKIKKEFLKTLEKYKKQP